MGVRVIEAVLRYKDEFTPGINKSIARMSAQQRKANQIGGKFQKVGAGLSKAGSGMTKAFTAPLAAVGVAAGKTYMDFESGMAKVATIADSSQVPMKELEKQIMATSDKTGVAAKDVAEQTYQAISAGQSTKNAVKAVNSAINLSKAGFTDVGSAMDVLTTIHNAYGKSAGSLTEISDVLINTQNKGKVTVDQLAGSMGKVIPTASAYNVGLKDLSAGYIELTKNGINAKSSTTYLNSMYNELGKSGTTASKMLKTATGKSFAELMKSGKSTGDVLQILQKQAKKTGTKFSDVFKNSNSAKAANTMIKHQKDLNKALKSTEKAAGTTKTALGKLGKTDQAKLNKQINRLRNDLIKLGSTVLPIIMPYIEKGLKFGDRLANKFNGLSKGQKDLIVKLLGIVAVAGPVLKIAGKGSTMIGGIVTKLPTMMGGISKAFGAVRFGILSIVATNPMLLVIIGVIAGIAVVALVIYKNWDKIVGFFKKTAKKMKTIGKGIKGVFTGIANHVKGKFQKGWKKGLLLAKAAYDKMPGWMQKGVKDQIKILTKITDFVKNVFKGNWKAAWKDVVDIFGTILSGLKTIAKAPLNGMIALVNTAIGGINKLAVTIPDWVPKVGGKNLGFHFNTIPYLARGTNNWKGGPAHVNEKGGEIIDLPRGTRVIPHDVSKKMAKKSSVKIYITGNAIYVRDTEEVNEVASELAYKVKLALENM